MMAAEHLLLAVLWIVYCIVHSLLASMAVKRLFQKKFKNQYKYYRLSYNLIAIAGLIAIILFHLSIDSILLFRPTALTDVIGASITVAGALLMYLCIKKYFEGLSGLQTFWKEKNSGELFITGIHRYVRHPLYLGTFGFIWGLLFLFPTVSLLVSTAVITVYTLIGIRLEEKKLVVAFGDDYRAYQRKVPMLIPKFRAAENS